MLPDKLDSRKILSNIVKNKRLWSAAIIYLIGFASVYLPDIGKNPDTRQSKLENQTPKSPNPKEEQLQISTPTEALKLEYGDIINLANQLGIRFIFIENQIKFWAQTDQERDYLVFRLKEIQTPHTKGDIDELPGHIITIQLGWRGLLREEMDTESI